MQEPWRGYKIFEGGGGGNKHLNSGFMFRRAGWMLGLLRLQVLPLLHIQKISAILLFLASFIQFNIEIVLVNFKSAINFLM